MRVAVASSGDSLEAQMDPRFGRCAYFVIVNTDDMSFEAIENPGPQMGSGAGIAAAQLIGDAGADAVVAANYGPNAAQALQAGGIRTFQAAGMTVGDAAQAAAAGQLPEIAGPTVADRAGMSMGPGPTPGAMPGGGMGGSRGMGGGRGMGMGGGRGMGGGGQAGYAQQPPMDPAQQGWGMGPMPGMMPPMPGMMPPMPGMMGPMPSMMGPMGPMMGPASPQAQEEMHQYHLAMLRAQADMLEQQLEFVRSQIEYLEDLDE